MEGDFIINTSKNSSAVTANISDINRNISVSSATNQSVTGAESNSANDLGLPATQSDLTFSYTSDPFDSPFANTSKVSMQTEEVSASKGDINVLPGNLTDDKVGSHSAQLLANKGGDIAQSASLNSQQVSAVLLKFLFSLKYIGIVCTCLFASRQLQQKLWYSNY